MMVFETGNLAVQLAFLPLQKEMLELQQASLALQEASLAVQRTSVWVAAIVGAAKCMWPGTDFSFYTETLIATPNNIEKT